MKSKGSQVSRLTKIASGSRTETRYFAIEERLSIWEGIDRPILVVEGKSDARVWRWIEEYLRKKIDKLDIEVMHGRSELLKLYKAYKKKITKACAEGSSFPPHPIIFVADRDLEYLEREPPKCYNGIIWTEGYNIENDLYAGAEELLQNLIPKSKLVEFKHVRYALISWYAFEVEEFRSGNRAKTKYDKKTRNVDILVPPPKTALSQEFREERGYRKPDPTTIKEINRSHQLKLNGKFLFDLIKRRFLDATDTSAPSFDQVNLEYIALNGPSHTQRDNLVKEVNKRL